MMLDYDAKYPKRSKRVKNRGLRLSAIFLVLIICTTNSYSQLSEDHINAFNSVKKVRIIGEHFLLKGIGNLSFTISPVDHFKDTAKILFESHGIEAVDADAENYDATLRIQTKSVLFLDQMNDSCLLSGSISLEVPGVPCYEKHFHNHVYSGNTVYDLKYLSRFILAVDVAAIFAHGSFMSRMIEMIREIYSKDFLNSIFEETGEDSEMNKVNAAFVAGEIKDNGTVESLINALNDESRDVRAMAAWALGEINDMRSIEPLISALNDKKEKVRKYAVQALAKMNYDRPIDTQYTGISSNKDKYVQFLAKAVLRQMKDNQGVEEIIEALNDKKPAIRKMAAESLVEINDTSAVEPLISSLNDKDILVNKEVANSLHEITGQDFGENQQDWREWWNQNKENFLKDR